MARILVIGGGPAGCVATHFMSRLGHEVTLIEKSAVIGGGGRTLYHRGHPYTFGPRHFLTKREDVWNYMNEFCPMQRFQGHEFLTLVNGEDKFFHFPAHEDEIDQHSDAAEIREELRKCRENNLVSTARNLEQFWQFSIGNRLYNKFTKGYTEKCFGGESATAITDFGFTTKGVALKTGPSKAAWDEAFTGFPWAKDGYNDYFEMAADSGAVNTNMMIKKYDIRNRRVMINDVWYSYDIIINTLSPEVLFNGCFGKLRWIGREFEKVVVPVEHLPNRHVFPPNVFFLYYAGAAIDEPITRAVEYKKFYHWDKDSPTTLIGIEKPSYRNQLYPYPTRADQAKAQKYLNLFPQDTYSIGRMGSYRYLDLGNIIEQCMDLAAKIGKAIVS